MLRTTSAARNFVMFGVPVLLGIWNFVIRRSRRGTQ